MNFGTMTVWNNRALALAMALDPDEALTAIQSGTLMYWLRRGLGDSILAVRLEELVRQQALDAAADKAVAGATLVMRAIAAAAGWLLTQVVPLIVRAMPEATFLARAARLRAVRERLIEARGLEQPPES